MSWCAFLFEYGELSVDRPAPTCIVPRLDEHRGLIGDEALSSATPMQVDNFRLVMQSERERVALYLPEAWFISAGITPWQVCEMVPVPLLLVQQLLRSDAEAPLVPSDPLRRALDVVLAMWSAKDFDRVSLAEQVQIAALVEEERRVTVELASLFGALRNGEIDEGDLDDSGRDRKLFKRRRELHAKIKAIRAR